MEILKSYPCFLDDRQVIRYTHVLYVYRIAETKTSIKKKIWLLHRSLKAGDPNVSKKPLIECKKFLLLALHIKLGLMKQFVKALDTNGDCFKYLVKRFPGLTDAKIKGEIFVGPQIRELMKITQFEDVMTNVEKNAWISFKEVVNGFLGNEKSSYYDKLVNNMLKSF